MFNAFWWLHFGLNHGGLKIKSQYHNVGNKEKGRISKRDFQKKQSPPNFPKNKRFLPSDTHTYVCLSGYKKCSFFGKFVRALFSLKTRFEIRTFPLITDHKF